MDTEELIAAAEGLVKELQGRINGGGMDLQEAEAKILEMVNWIGDAMVQEVVAGLAEPTFANQITVDGEVAGVASVRAPTCYKECNLVVVEKHCDGKVVDRWTGGRYGPRQEFAGHAEQAGLRMGFLDAPRTLFLGDGARHNWELQQTHFPGAIPILDYYHAAEHLAAYCKLLPATLRGAHEQSLSTMMWEGEVLQMIHEMKRSLSKVTNTDQAWKQINYFTNNQDRVDYARYRDVGWPIGSGLVEGQCKLVVGRRFKGNGMRWRPHDNRCVLRTRLALLNGDLKRYFEALFRQMVNHRSVIIGRGDGPDNRVAGSGTVMPIRNQLRDVHAHAPKICKRAASLGRKGGSHRLSSTVWLLSFRLWDQPAALFHLIPSTRRSHTTRRRCFAFFKAFAMMHGRGHSSFRK